MSGGVNQKHIGVCKPTLNGWVYIKVSVNP